MWKNQHRLLTRATGDVRSVKVTQTKELWQRSKTGSPNWLHPQQARKQISSMRPIATWYHGVTTFWVRHKGVLNVFSTWQRKQRKKHPRPAWVTTNSKTKNWKQWESYLKFARKSCFNVCVWLALADRIFCGPWISCQFMWRKKKMSPTNQLHSLHRKLRTTLPCRHKKKQASANQAYFKMPDFARDMSDAKSTSVFVMCTFRKSHICTNLVDISKKQTAVSPSSTEAETISLDAGSRMEGIPTFGLWDTVIDVLEPIARETWCENKNKDKLSNERKSIGAQKTSITYTWRAHFQQASIAFSCLNEEAVIKMSIKGRSPNMRHVSRTHRVDELKAPKSNMWTPTSRWCVNQGKSRRSRGVSVDFVFKKRKEGT